MYNKVCSAFNLLESVKVQVSDVTVLAVDTRWPEVDKVEQDSATVTLGCSGNGRLGRVAAVALPAASDGGGAGRGGELLLLLRLEDALLLQCLELGVHVELLTEGPSP